MNETLGITDYYSTSSGAVNGVTGFTTTNVASNNIVWANPIGQNNVEPVSEGDIFKQIVSLLGIKIANVKIEGGRVTLYGYRKKKKYIVEIECDAVTVKNEKGDIISKITLSLEKCGFGGGGGDSISIAPQPYIIYPSTTPNIYPFTISAGGTYTITNVDTTTGTYTLSPNSNIIVNKVEING